MPSRSGCWGSRDRMPSSSPTLTAVKVKICGLTTPAEASATAVAGADWIGLNFHPPSPRFVEPERAAAIIAALPPSAEAVGLFVNRPAGEVAATASRLGLRFVQLHGKEPVEDVRALRREGLTVIRAFRLGDAEAVATMTDWLARAKESDALPDAVLVDAHVPGQFGGTGQTIGEAVLDLLTTFCEPPGRQPLRLILAGGLTPENVAERVARVRPWMVDVAGGVEVSPGRKDPARVAAFIRAARVSRANLRHQKAGVLPGFHGSNRSRRDDPLALLLDHLADRAGTVRIGGARPGAPGRGHHAHPQRQRFSERSACQFGGIARGGVVPRSRPQPHPRRGRAGRGRSAPPHAERAGEQGLYPLRGRAVSRPDDALALPGGLRIRTRAGSANDPKPGARDRPRQSRPGRCGLDRTGSRARRDLDHPGSRSGTTPIDGIAKRG